MAGQSSMEELLFQIKVDPTQLERLAPLVSEELREAAAAASGFQVNSAQFLALGNQIGEAVFKGLQSFMQGKSINLGDLFQGQIDPTRLKGLQQQVDRAASVASSRFQDPGVQQQVAQLRDLITQRERLARTELPKGPIYTLDRDRQPRQRAGVDILRETGATSGVLQPTYLGNGQFNQAAMRQQLDQIRREGLADLDREISRRSQSLNIPAPQASTQLQQVTQAAQAVTQAATGGSGKPPGSTPPPVAPGAAPEPEKPRQAPTSTIPGRVVPGAQADAARAQAGGYRLEDNELDAVRRALGGILDEEVTRRSRAQAVTDATRGLAAIGGRESISGDPLLAEPGQRRPGLAGISPAEQAAQAAALAEASRLSRADEARRSSPQVRRDGSINEQAVDRLQRALQGLQDKSDVRKVVDDLISRGVQPGQPGFPTDPRFAAAYPDRLATAQLQAEAERRRIQATQPADTRARQGQAEETRAGNLRRQDVRDILGPVNRNDALEQAVAQEQSRRDRAASALRRVQDQQPIAPLTRDQEREYNEGQAIRQREAALRANQNRRFDNGVFTAPQGTAEEQRIYEQELLKRAREQTRRDTLGTEGVTPQQVESAAGRRTGLNQARQTLAEAQTRTLEQEIDVARRVGEAERRNLRAREQLAQEVARGNVAATSPGAQMLTARELRQGENDIQRERRNRARQNQQEDLVRYLDNDQVPFVRRAQASLTGNVPGGISGRGGFRQEFREGFLGERSSLGASLGQAARFSTLYGGIYSLLGLVSQGFSQAVSGALQFEDALVNLNIATNASSASNAALADQLSAVGTELGYGAAVGVQVGTNAIGLYGVANGTDTERDTLSVLSTEVAGRLGRIGNTDPLQVSNAVASVVNAFGFSAYDQTRIEDITSVISKQTGISSSDLLSASGNIGQLSSSAGFDYATTLAFLGKIRPTAGSADAAAGGLRQVLSQADNPNIERRLAGVGVNVQGTTLSEQFQEFASKYASGEVNQSTFNQVSSVFGRGASGTAFQVIIRDMAEIQRLANEANNAPEGVGKENANELLASFGNQAKILGAELQTLLNELVKTGAFDFLYLLVESMRLVVNVVDNVISGFNALPDGIQKTIVYLAEFLLALKAYQVLGLPGLAAARGAAAAAGAAVGGTRIGGALAGAGGALAATRAGAATTGVVGAGGRAVGRAPNAIGGGLATLFASGLGGALTIGGLGVANGLYQAETNTNRGEALLAQANRAGNNATDVEGLNDAISQYKEVIAQSRDQQNYFKFGSLSTLGIEAIYSNLGFSSSNNRQDQAREAIAGLEERARVVSEAQDAAEKANPAATFNDFSSVDAVATSVEQLGAKGLTAANQLDALNTAFDALIIRNSGGIGGTTAGGDTVAGYLLTGQGPLFGQGVGEAGSQAIQTTVDNVRNRARNPEGGGGSEGGRNRRAGNALADELDDIQPGDVQSGLSKVAEDVLNERGKDPSAGPVIVTDADLDAIREASHDFIEKSIRRQAEQIPWYKTKPSDEEVDQAVADAVAEYDMNLPATTSKFVGGTATAEQTLAYLRAAGPLAQQAGQAAAALDGRNQLTGANTTLAELRKTRALAVKNIANITDPTQRLQAQQELQAVDILIAQARDDQVSARAAEAQAMAATEKSKLNMNDAVGRAQADLSAITSQLTNPELSPTQRLALQAQQREQQQVVAQAQRQATAANRLAGISPTNDAARLRGQLTNAQGEIDANAPRQGETPTAAYGQAIDQYNQLAAQLREREYTRIYQQDLVGAGRNQQQQLQAATNDARRRLAEASAYGDPASIAQATNALRNAELAEVQYSLDLNYQLAQNQHPNNTLALLQDAINDANRRLQDAITGGDPAEIAKAQAALDTANSKYIDRSLQNASAARDAARDPLDSRQAAQDAITDAEQALQRAQTGGFDQGDIDAAQAALNKARSDASKYQLDLEAAQRSLTVAPDDRLGNARVAVENAQAAFNFYASRGLQNTIEFVQAQQALQNAQFQFAQAQLQVIEQTNIALAGDSSDPVRAAQIRLEQLLAQQRAASTAEEKRALQPQIDSAQTDVTLAPIDKKLRDIGNQKDLKQINDAEYISALQEQLDAVNAMLALMDPLGEGYDAMAQKAIEIQKLIQGAVEAVNSEFNLNDVTLPTVYEVRRAVGASAADIRSQVVDYSSTQGTVIINGADMTQVIAYINQTLGTGSQAVNTTRPRRT